MPDHDDLLARLAAAERRAADYEWRWRTTVTSTAWRLTWPLRAAGLAAKHMLRPAPAHPEPVPEVQAPPGPVPGQALSPRIMLPRAEHPAVSIIVTSYGQVDVTLRCLASIAAAPPVAAIEIIVIDNASGDPRISEIAAVDGVRLIVNPHDVGYLRSCNIAAAQAAPGAHILLLNNDIEVLPGWLDAMLDLLTARPDSGAVCCKLLFPNGTLQEAGAIVWDNAFGWNYGRGDNPGEPRFQYVREVDYGSAACLLVRGALFHALGGYDERYVPAYYEDVDLCFRLRDAGHPVLFQPRAAVIHYEGMTHGTDTGGGVKAHQLRNQRVFLDRWGDTLARDHFPSGRHELRARDRAPRRTVVAVVDHYVPEPDRDAGSRAMLAMLQAFQASGAVVKFITPHQRPGLHYRDALLDAGIEIVDVVAPGEFAHWMERNGEDLDHIVIARPHIATGMIGPARAWSDARVWYYPVDHHFARTARQAAITDEPGLIDESQRWERVDRRLWRLADGVLCLSPDETDEVLARDPGVHARTVVPFAFDHFAGPRTPPGGHDLLFVAGFAHPPNEDAAIWLVADILPRIHARVPDAVLHIIGSHPTDRVRALAGDAVRVIPNVSDGELSQAYADARVAVVPLRFGAGVKLKVVEALRDGLPLVTTPTGAQGLLGLADVARVESDAKAFADAAIALLVDDTLWQDQSGRQSAYAAARFSRDAHRRALLAAMGAAGDTL